MEYLLLVVLSIIFYAEILPTISVLFELIRTIIIAKTAIIQQKTIHVQEDIQNTQDRMESSNNVAIGFHTSQIPLEMEGEDE